MIVTVICQNAEGKRVEIEVQADTDTAACDAVLRLLNSWRAIRVDRAPLSKADQPPPPRPESRKPKPPKAPVELAASHREQGTLKPIRSTGVRDWIGMSPVNHLGAVGRA